MGTSFHAVPVRIIHIGCPAEVYQRPSTIRGLMISHTSSSKVGWLFAFEIASTQSCFKTVVRVVARDVLCDEAIPGQSIQLINELCYARNNMADSLRKPPQALKQAGRLLFPRYACSAYALPCKSGVEDCSLQGVHHMVVHEYLSG